MKRSQYPRMKSDVAAAKQKLHAAPATGILAYCRPGFEGECAQELSAHASAHNLSGFARTERGAGFVEYVLADGGVRVDVIPWRSLIFARQSLRAIGRAERMPRD